MRAADIAKRTGLLSLLGTLANNTRPLEVPNEYLFRIARAYQRGEAVCSASVEGDSESLWHLLQSPRGLMEDGPSYLAAWSGENESLLLQANTEARSAFQSIIASGTEKRPRSAARWIRQFMADEVELTGYLSPMYQHATGARIEQSAVQKFLTEAPEWRLYLCTWMHSAYRQAIQLKNFGKGKNAGMMDLLCAVYLTRCDVFVTHDTAQRRALRLLAHISPNRPRIQSWVDFRRRLLVL